MRVGIMASVVAAGVLLTGGTALADDATPTGVELGLRAGYGIPLGSITGAPSGATAPAMSDYLSGMIPIQVDAGYRFNPNMMVGAFFQYGIGMLNTSSGKPLAGCSASGVSCSGNDLAFGAQFHYHLMPDQTIDPWGGIGVGYEILNVSESAGGQSGGGAFSGFQFVDLQLGADYKVMPNLGVGPYIGFSLGEYSSCSVQGASSCTINQTALHEWLTIGLRGAYDINM